MVWCLNCNVNFPFRFNCKGIENVENFCEVFISMRVMVILYFLLSIQN